MMTNPPAPRVPSIEEQERMLLLPGFHGGHQPGEREECGACLSLRFARAVRPLLEELRTARLVDDHPFAVSAESTLLLDALLSAPPSGEGAT